MSSDLNARNEGQDQPAAGDPSRIPAEMLHRPDEHWSDTVAKRVLEIFPHEEIYTGAAGISPSGTVHFGNLRDVMTTWQVLSALKALGKPVRFIFSWDDYDRFRKVPQGVDASFEQYIGLPLSKVPDPFGELPSYARHFEAQFERTISRLGIPLEYRSQTEMYTRGDYDQQILHALAHRQEIADILLQYMSDKAKTEKKIDPGEYRRNYYPISIYSRFTGKDNTVVLEYDHDLNVTYRCQDTGRVDTVDLTRDHIAKLSWKTDWPMRWGFERVVFEPGGKDHASPAGSFEVASRIVRSVFRREPPVFVGYDFIGLRGLGGKMSGSSGNAVSPAQLLEIYQPTLLNWLYTRKTPDQTFSLAFDTEIYRQYDELDREIAAARQGELDQPRSAGLRLAAGGVVQKSGLPSIPFRQAVAFGQIMQWDAEKVKGLCAELNMNYDPLSIEERLILGRNWLETYNPSQMIRLRDSVNRDYAAAMSPQARQYVKRLKLALQEGVASHEDLETLVYAIPKDLALDLKQNSVRQRAFFKDAYNLLITADTGPRLSTFLWALKPEAVIPLLELESE